MLRPLLRYACGTSHDGRGIFVDGRRTVAPIQVLRTGDDLLPDAGERAAIDAAMETLRHSLSGADADSIRAATAVLNRLTTPYAARRMDHAVRGALSGQNIQEFG